MVFYLIRYVIKAALRDKLFISLLIAMVLGTSLSIFMGASAVIEQTDFVRVFAGGGLRLIGVFGLVLFTVFFIRRSFEAHDIEYVLSRPVSRAEFLFSYAAGFSILALLTALTEGICLYVISAGQIEEGAFLWMLSIAAENIIMANTSLFFAMLLSSPATASMAIFGLYVLARMMGQILGIMNAGGKASLFEGLEYTMQMVSAIVPRLDLMGQTSWLIYGAEEGIGIGFILMQCLLFSILVLLAALIDLTKRQF